MSRNWARLPATPAANSPHHAAASAATPASSARTAAAALREVCVAAASYARATGSTLSPPGPAVAAALARTVHAYAEQCRGEQLLPERALVQLKQALADCAPHLGHARGGQEFRDAVFATFIGAYFPRGAAPAGANGDS